MQYEFLRAIDGPGRPVTDVTLTQMDSIIDWVQDETPMPSAEIARRLELPAARCAQICDILIERGILELGYNDKGGRVYSLTDRAKEKVCAEKNKE